MRPPHKIQRFSNFSRAIQTRSKRFRPENEKQLCDLMTVNSSVGLLARGQGLSYSDCCVLNHGDIIDTSRLNHLLSFDPNSGIVVCQAAVTFADLLLIDPLFIPPVIPGTLHATLAGAVANDVHGKNNPHTGSFGQHVVWFELQVGSQSFRCSRNENTTLFFATLGGLGLTGVIKQIAIRLRKASHFVSKRVEKFNHFSTLLNRMQHVGTQYDYQVAWLDLLNQPVALLSLANHVEKHLHLKRSKPKRIYTIPFCPVRLIGRRLMKQLNRRYYLRAKTTEQIQTLAEYNNPLDRINHWNCLYGQRGLLQFQAVFDAEFAEQTLNQLLACIQKHRAIATLAVLKYFNQSGIGLLSFTQPGFTIAIDFIHNQSACKAIDAMNQLITDVGGKIYLAKDLRLKAAQFKTMYPHHEAFSDVLTHYQSPMRSDLGKRLELTQ